MPPIRSLVFKHLTYHFKLVAIIFFFSKIMPSCFYYIEKELVYIAITALFSYQPSFCFKYIKLNIYLSCNIHFIFNAKYIYLTIYLYTY
jgi:hypothetical protein